MSRNKKQEFINRIGCEIGNLKGDIMKTNYYSINQLQFKTYAEFTFIEEDIQKALEIIIACWKDEKTQQAVDKVKDLIASLKSNNDPSGALYCWTLKQIFNALENAGICQCVDKLTYYIIDSRKKRIKKVA